MPRRNPRTVLDRMRTPRGIPGFLKTASVCALIAGLLSPLSQAAASETETAQTTAAGNDYCGDQYSDILPPSRTATPPSRRSS
ncbi:hypothetical protein SGRIM128S_02152 [Streptomyces griseomycini]